MKIVFSCLMEFENYPFDTQTCGFHILSAEHAVDEMVLFWDKMLEKVVTDYDQYLPQYHFTSVNRSVSNFHSAEESNERQQWSSLRMNLTFKRKMGLFLRILYIPFLILVALSWLSFWIPAKLFAPRLSLLTSVMILVFMVHIGYELNAKPPTTSYYKASDVWIAVCESLVFSAFVEFLVVHVIGKLQVEMNMSNSEEINSDGKLCLEKTEQPNKAMAMIFKRLKRDVLLSGRIDQICRVLFPAFFVLFNFIYWIVYCNWE